MIEFTTVKWWNDEKDKELTEKYSLSCLLISYAFTLNEEEYTKLEKLLRNSSTGTRFKVSIEKIEEELDERESEYYDSAYQKVEELMYDQ